MERPSDDAEIRAHADLVFRTCLRLTGNAQDAADVSQEVFVAWLRARGTIRGPVGAWLHGTARQRAMDFLRSGHRRVQHERQADAPAELIGDDGWRTHLDDALNELDGTSRALVIERHLMGVDQGRLAARFRCTQATVSRRLTKALEHLRGLLERRGVHAAPTVLPLWFAQNLGQPPCPGDLVAPVLAQAQVTGAAGLLGPAVIGTGWITWLGVAAATGVTLALLGGAGLWWWRTATFHEIDRDWTTVATAHLPPVTMTVPAPASGPRYPSIEALIARLPKVDAARQERVRRLIVPENGKAWSSFEPLNRRYAIDPSPGATTLTASQRDIADAGYAFIQPLVSELVAGDTLIGSCAWLADDYQAGRLGSWTLRTAWFARMVAPQVPTRRMLVLLSEHAERADDPRPALAEVDAVVNAHLRSSMILIDGLVGIALMHKRDELYLRLIYANRLPEAAARRWCAEPSPAQDLMGNVILGEALLMQLPLLDDIRAGRSIEPMISDWDPIGALNFAHALTWLPPRLAIINDALHGGDGTRFRHLTSETDSMIIKMLWPAQRVSLVVAAKTASSHHARRRAATLLLDARAGKALPDAVPDLAAGPADAWKMRYERLSPTRFRLVVDPTAGMPAYAEDGDARELVTKLGLPRVRTSDPGFEDHGVNGIEIEIPPPNVTPVLPPRSDDTEEPLPPRATQ